MFGYSKYGTCILDFIIESSPGYSCSVSNLDEILKYSNIKLQELNKIFKHYPGVTIHNYCIIWIKTEEEAKQLVDELNILITLTGVRKVYV